MSWQVPGSRKGNADVWAFVTRLDSAHRQNTHKIQNEAGDDCVGQASGFWVENIDPEFPYKSRFREPGLLFVTNRHVLDSDYRCNRASGFSLSSICIFSFDVHGNPHNPLLLTANNGNDVCVHIPDDLRLDIAVISVSGDSLIQWHKELPRRPAGLITVPREILAGDDVFHDHELLAFGALVSFSSFQEWTDDFRRPILRTGNVASDPMHSYECNGIDRKDILLLESRSFAGSSGSLVMANPVGHPIFDDFTDSSGTRYRYVPPKVIGIMCGHHNVPVRAMTNEKNDDRYVVHAGLSYCHKSTCLLDVICGKEKLIHKSDVFVS